MYDYAMLGFYKGAGSDRDKRRTEGLRIDKRHGTTATAIGELMLMLMLMLIHGTLYIQVLGQQPKNEVKPLTRHFRVSDMGGKMRVQHATRGMVKIRYSGAIEWLNAQIKERQLEIRGMI